MRFLLAKWTIAVLIVLSSSCGQSDLSDGQPHLDLPAPTSPVRLEITQISSQPRSVRPGQVVLISVSTSSTAASAITYFWRASGGSFSDPQANPASWTAPATDGNFSLTVDASSQHGAARGYLSVVVSVSAPPILISTVSPAEAQVGQTVAIDGYGFGVTQGDSTVDIGGVPAAEIVRWTDTQVVVNVPASASTGNVLVTVAGNTSNPSKLVVLWPTQNPENTPVSSAASAQRTPNIIQDGAGGSLVVWEDARNGAGDIFAQRLGKKGEPLWASEGLPVIVVPGMQTSPTLLADGASGAIVVWQDYRDGDADIYAQRINASGDTLWSPGGIALVTAVGDQLAPQIIGDGTGGAIVVWEDHRGGNGDIYAQRIDADGLIQWAADGGAVSATAEHQFSPKAAIDAAGGAFVVWEDYRSGIGYDVYGQRLTGAGTPEWTTNGVVVSAASRNQLSPQVIADGSSGAIVAWEDYRGGTAADIYAQRIDSAGVATWTTTGVAISAATNNQRAPQIVADESGGAFIAWEDYRNGNADVFAQHIDALGVRQWTANGTVVNASANAQLAPRVVLDRVGGIIVAWNTMGDNGSDVFMQRLNSEGALLWTADALAVCSATGDQSAVQIIEDGSEGAVVTWTDSREPTTKVYAQGVSASGRQ